MACRRFLRIAALLAGGALVLATPNRSYADVKSLSSAVEAAYRRQDCDFAWKLLWNASKAGDQDARTMLSLHLATQSLAPTGLLREKEKIAERLALIVLYGAEEEFDISISLAKEFVETLPVADNNKALVSNCLNHKSKIASCLRKLSRSNVIPTFEAFSAEIDALAKDDKNFAICGKRPTLR